MNILHPRQSSSLSCYARKIFLLRLPQLSVLTQLILEEALYRCTSPFNSSGWVLYNDYTVETLKKKKSQCYSIVLGRSQKPRDMVFEKAVKEDNVPMIRRYSGGGTVVISPNAFLVTFLLPRDFFHQANPRVAMKWSRTNHVYTMMYSDIYYRVFGDPFVLKENDYTAGGVRKFGGNAQAFSRSTLSHHTSFLWRADEAAFERYLKLPRKKPEYRQSRSHEDFVCGIEDMFSHRFKSSQDVCTTLTQTLRSEFHKKNFVFEEISWADIKRDLEMFVEIFLRSDYSDQVVNLVDINGNALLDMKTTKLVF